MSLAKIGEKKPAVIAHIIGKKGTNWLHRNSFLTEATADLRVKEKQKNRFIPWVMGGGCDCSPDV